MTTVNRLKPRHAEHRVQQQRVEPHRSTRSLSLRRTRRKGACVRGPRTTRLRYRRPRIQSSPAARRHGWPRPRAPAAAGRALDPSPVRPCVPGRSAHTQPLCRACTQPNPRIHGRCVPRCCCCPVATHLTRHPGLRSPPGTGPSVPRPARRSHDAGRPRPWRRRGLPRATGGVRLGPGFPAGQPHRTTTVNRVKEHEWMY